MKSTMRIAAEFGTHARKAVWPPQGLFGIGKRIARGKPGIVLGENAEGAG